MAERRSAHKAHILVVDEDRVVRATIGRGLAQAGYRVSEAASGEEALQRARESPPDVALLDMRMPGMSGLEVAAELGRTHGVPFLFLSAYGDEETVREAARHGALGYLVKPLDVLRIVPAIEAALARAAEIRALRQKESQLSSALEGGREVSVAVGILMERRGLGREEAFEVLRGYARARRAKIAEVAAEIVRAAETINRPGRAAD